MKKEQAFDIFKNTGSPEAYLLYRELWSMEKKRRGKNEKPGLFNAVG